MSDAADRKRVVRDDDRFFRKHPGRQYRIRRASPVEIREKQINGGLPPLPQGWRWFLAIWNPAPGRRVCLFAPNLEGAATDPDEGTAHVAFDNLVDIAGGADATRH